MGEEFCSEEVCSSVLEFSKGVLEQVFEEFEDAELERQYELLHTSSLQNSSPIPFNGHLLVINAPANKWSLRAPWAPKLYHCEIEREVVFEYEIEIEVVVYEFVFEVVFDYEIEVVFEVVIEVVFDYEIEVVFEVVIEVVFDYEIEVVFD